MISLTPIRMRLLQYVADYKIASLPQLALLACPSEKSARRHLRELFDAGLVEVVAVPRAALAEAESVNDAGLLFGSAPNLYTMTREGMRMLYEAGWMEEMRPIPSYGPKNSLFLAHELAVKEVRVWLELAARRGKGHRLLCWQEGAEGEIDLKRSQPPKMVRPDAWFVYGLGEKVLVGLVEVDRGTERGGKRWLGKLAAYEALFRRDMLHEATGYKNARVLVITPTVRRRDALAQFIQGNAPEEVASRFWLAERSVLTQLDLTTATWHQPGNAQLRPLLSVSFETKR